MQAREGDASARVAAMVVAHHDTLLRVARQVSICADDAHDAVQRGLEIYLRRLDRVDRATELAWLKVVVRNEALSVRKARGALGEVNVERHVSPDRDPLDRAASAERIARSAEALQRLKRDEARALVAKSMGLSYDEIAQRFGWTYTKVNRCLTEGRARFLRVYRDIEEGEECRRFAPALMDLADGVRDSEAIVALRPHLRTCSSCRATVRHLHGTRRQRVAAALLLPAKWVWDRFVAAKAEAYAAATRVSELAATVPVGSGRGAAATALVGLCVGTACVVDAPPERRVERASVQRAARVQTDRLAAPPPQPAVRRAPRAQAAQAAPPRPAPEPRPQPVAPEFRPRDAPAEFAAPPPPPEFETPAAATASFEAQAPPSGEFR